MLFPVNYKKYVLFGTRFYDLFKVRNIKSVKNEYLKRMKNQSSAVISYVILIIALNHLQNTIHSIHTYMRISSYLVMAGY